MEILVLKLPNVNRESEEQPKECPYCHGETFQHWERVKKPVKDMQARSVWVYHYRCCRCRRTFRHYPAGTSRADQTERLRSYAVLGWRLGLSYRDVSLLLSGIHVSVCPMIAWWDAQGEKQEVAAAERMETGVSAGGGWGLCAGLGGEATSAGGGRPGGRAAGGSGVFQMAGRKYCKDLIYTETLPGPLIPLVIFQPQSIFILSLAEKDGDGLRGGLFRF